METVKIILDVIVIILDIIVISMIFKEMEGGK